MDEVDSATTRVPRYIYIGRFCVCVWSVRGGSDRKTKQTRKVLFARFLARPLSLAASSLLPPRAAPPPRIYSLVVVLRVCVRPFCTGNQLRGGHTTHTFWGSFPPKSPPHTPRVDSGEAKRRKLASFFFSFLLVRACRHKKRKKKDRPPTFVCASVRSGENEFHSLGTIDA
jgi:hypothetical protein